VIPNPLPGRLPHKLEPGEIWRGLIDQNELGEEVYKKGIFMIKLYLSHINKPKKVRVRTIKLKQKEEDSDQPESLK